LSSSISQETSRSGVLPILGLIIGSHLMASFLIIGFLAPALPLLLAGATAISARTRPFAIGSLAAALGGVVLLITYAAAQSL
jgi:hypothetical protein